MTDVEKESNRLDPVDGLVDNRRAAAMLGVSVGTFRVWATRSLTAKSGISTAMPVPVATMHGHVYRVEDIEEFGRQIALSSRALRTQQRSLGAYFTPNDAAELMVRWAVRHSEDVLLEPSLGDGQFAIAAQRFANSRGWGKLDIHACELDPETAGRAVASGAVASDRVRVGDFLSASDLPVVDAVIGNPPYVRVRELDSSLRKSALNSAQRTMGQPMDPAGSVWMPFVAKGTEQLRRGGRLALVLPLDFTYVKYARSLWSFLGQSYGRIRILRFRKRVFPEIMQNVLILLAENKGSSTSEVELIARERLADLPDGQIGAGVKVSIDEVARGDRAFQFALLPTRARETLTILEPLTGAAHSRVKFNIGYVSGNKKFFHPDSSVITEFGLPPESLRPTVESSRQLSRVGLGTGSEVPTAFLWTPGDQVAEQERAYVEHGSREGVDMAYKCRIRNPWFRVPGVKVPDVFLTTFSDRPRLHLNDAGWVASNSVLSGFTRPDESPRAFVESWYTPLTLLSTELHIHSLGGGVMIAVPREADSVRLLKHDVTLRPELDRLDDALKSGHSDSAYNVGAESISNLVGSEGLAAIQEGADVLTRWRKSRG